MPHFSIDEMERRAAEFSKRYGAENGWSDEQLDRALSDHDLPPLSAIPSHGVQRGGGPYGGPTLDAEDRRRWRRMNATHMLGHIILHNGERCGACKSWGVPDGPAAE